MVVTDQETIILSEEDIQVIINDVNDYLSGISLSDIEPDTESSSYSSKDNELEIKSLPGLMVYIDWTADYWYKCWTEYWTDPVCYPEFSDGGVDDVWCDGIELMHDEYEIENCEKINERICKAVYGKAKTAYDERMARKRAARERILAKQRAKYAAKREKANPKAV